MTQVAIFVDAGYLFAAGGVAVAGRTVKRSEMALDVEAAVKALRSMAEKTAPNSRLLRIYWYDGSIAGGRPTSDQSLVANTNDVKLRLGHVNSKGEQKEVDSIIVTDLIELARLNSISDAVILAGDGDLRVGVSIAQNYGVRVHLLGIEPTKSNQSPQLREEADTNHVWSKDDVSPILSRREIVAGPIAGLIPTAADADKLVDRLSATVTLFVSQMKVSDLEQIEVYWREGHRGLPSNIDGELLRACACALGRQLDEKDRRGMRKTCGEAIRTRLSAEQ